MLAKLMSMTWWVLLLKGTVSIVFGIVAYAWPGMTLASLVTVFGAFALVDGVFGVLQAIGGRKEHEHWWVVLLEGLLGILFGWICLTTPGITVTVLMLFIAFWAISTGVMRIVMAVRLRKEIEGEWWMALSGLVSVIFGVVVIAQPGEGALALLWLVAIWAILAGAFLVFLAFKVKGLAGKLAQAKQRLAEHARS